MLVTMNAIGKGSGWPISTPLKLEAMCAGGWLYCFTVAPSTAIDGTFGAGFAAMVARSAWYCSAGRPCEQPGASIAYKQLSAETDTGAANDARRKKAASTALVLFISR